VSNIEKIQSQFDLAVLQIQVDAWIRHQENQLMLAGFKPVEVESIKHLDDVSYLAGRLHQLEDVAKLLKFKNEIEVI
jgi:hypothetical protein